MEGYSWYSSHDFIDVHLAVVDVFAHGALIVEFFHVFHGVGAIIGGDGSGLSYGVDVSHVADGGSDCFILVFDEVVDLFIGGVGAGDEVVLVEVGIIGSRCIGGGRTETTETILRVLEESL